MAYSQSIISAIVSITFGGLALIILLVDETDNGFADIYSGAVSIQNIQPRFKQWKLVVIITVVSTFLATLIPQYGQNAYETFLISVGAIFVPLLGVLFMDFYIIKRKQYSLEEFYSSARGFKINPLISWFIGIIVYFAFYNYTTFGSSIPSFIVSAITLYVLEKAT